MSDKPTVFGFLGSNPATPEAITDNLADSMPEEAVFVVPENISKGKTEHAGLRAAIKWLSSEYDPDDLVYSDDIVTELVNYQRKGHEAVLLLLLDPESELDKDVWAEAASFNIEVCDLAQNMYVLGNPTPPAVSDMTPAEIDSNPEIPSEPRTRGVPRDLPAEEKKVILENAERAMEGVRNELENRAVGDVNPEDIISTEQITNTLIRFIRLIVRQEIHRLGLVPGVNKPPAVERTVEPMETADTPPWTEEPATTPAPPLPSEVVPRKKYAVDTEGMHRPRRPGRLPAGYTQVLLSPDEQSELRQAGKLID